MSADAKTPVLPVTDASARESFMYAQLAVRGVATNSIGTALTVDLSKAWDAYLDGVKAEAVAALSTPPTDDVREALAAVLDDSLLCWTYNGTHTVFHPTMGADAVLARFEVRPRGIPVTDGEPVGLCSQCGEPFGEHSCAPIPSCIHVGPFPAEVRPRGTVTDDETRDVTGFEGTRDALDSLTIRGGESS